MGLLPLSKYLQAPTDFSFDKFNADIRALFFDNRLAVSSKHVSCVVDFRSDFFIQKIYGIDARVFSNTLYGDYNSSPSDTLATRGP